MIAPDVVQLIREFGSFGLLIIIVITGVRYIPRIAVSLERIENKLENLK